MWLNTLPQPRVDGGGQPLWWQEGFAPGPVETSYTGRDFENMTCDTRGGVGYGLVLSEGGNRLEDISTYQGQTLNGAFTIWIRRPLQVNDQGDFADVVGNNDSLVIVSEGRAPFSGSTSGGGTEAAFIRARQAVRVLETRFVLDVLSAGDPCLGTQAGQEGMSPTGENFNACAAITAGAGGSLEGAFGTAGSGGTGALTGTGVE
jgi:hypothetical protein